MPPTKKNRLQNEPRGQARTDSTRRSSGKKPPTVIGFAEQVDLPDWGIRRLKAKIDTGARSCALHVTRLKELPDNRVRFEIVRQEGKAHVPVEAEISRVGTVKPSSGKRERRYFVKTRLTLGGKTRTVEISLAKRSTMRYRMLVGRAALKGYLVNAEHRYLLSKKPKGDPEAQAAGEERTATANPEDRTAT